MSLLLTFLVAYLVFGALFHIASIVLEPLEETGCLVVIIVVAIVVVLAIAT